MHLRVAECLCVEYHYHQASPAAEDLVDYHSLLERDFEVLFE